MKKRYHIVIAGEVQGVCFRAYTREKAMQLNVCGYVRNLPDATVEAVIEGEEAATEKMLQWFYQGSPLSRVEAVHAKEETPTHDTKEFRILY